MDDFLIRAAAAGIGLALVLGPLGVFVVWRRMAYFGDTVAHAGLLGVALGLLLGLDPHISVIVIGIALSGLLLLLQRRRTLAGDTSLGILAHGGLALGLLALAGLKGVRVDLMTYLFGDILATSNGDLLWVWGGGALVLAPLLAIWRPLLFLTVNEDLARAHGIKALPIQLVFMVLVAVVVALAMKIVGILLVTALLLIPAAAARALARTPEQMALIAVAAGCLSVAAGLAASFYADLPSGPAIVVAALALFALSLVLPGRWAGLSAPR